MKQTYKLVFEPKEKHQIASALRFKGTLWQANKAFQGLRIALHDSTVKKIQLLLIGKDESTYLLNSVDCTGGENGL